MIKTLLLFLQFFVTIAVQAFDATSTYQQTNVAGFKLLVNFKLSDRPFELEQVIKEIARQAAQIQKAVDAPVLKFLESVPIWVEWQVRTNGAAEYHPSGEWLQANGYNPDKTKCIEINNAQNFVKWSREHQPSMLLHELGHAFHDQVLGWDDADIKRAFNQARDSGRYERVAHVDGRKTRSYALTDEKEYFAELSEAYFGRNDFYPFTRAELQTFDEIGCSVVGMKWNGQEKPGETGRYHLPTLHRLRVSGSDQ